MAGLPGLLGLGLAALLALSSRPALGARRFTTEQLRQTLASAEAAHRSDEATAHQLDGVRLSYRMSAAELQSLLASSPGLRTTQAVRAIADAATFLNPPPDQVLNRPTPDLPAQQAMMAKVIHFAAGTLPTLPNFLATRVTEQYVDSMLGLPNDMSQPRGELFLVGTYSAPITYRNGHESDDPMVAAAAAETAAAPPSKARSTAAKNVPRPPSPAELAPHKGLSSWGEFGPVLQVVLNDSAKGKITWARWQLSTDKPVAVFKFSVDRSLSHYVVNYCCDVSKDFGFHHTATVHTLASMKRSGYHGSIEIDPDTGTVLSIIIEADPRPDDPVQRAQMMVEYGPVKIGDRIHICPTRSVSIDASRENYFLSGRMQSINRLLLDDVQFTGYHRFGSESTVTAEPPPSPTSQPAMPVVTAPDPDTAQHMPDPVPASPDATPAPQPKPEPAPPVPDQAKPAPPGELRF